RIGDADRLRPATKARSRSSGENVEQSSDRVVGTPDDREIRARCGPVRDEVDLRLDEGRALRRRNLRSVSLEAGERRREAVEGGGQCSDHTSTIGAARVRT